MGPSEGGRLYALVLALVPDVDAASDIFMASRDEADLRRRALVWRREAGLSEEPSGAVHELSTEEQAFALHLARRARVRRWLARVAVIMAAVTVVAGAAVFWPLLRPGALVKDPAFVASGRSARTTDGAQFTVHKAELLPGQLTVWWSVEGPEAGKLKKGAPFLTGAPAQHRNPVATETLLIQSDRLLGKSVYNPVYSGFGNVPARIELQQAVLVVQPEWGEGYPGARVQRVERDVTYGGAAVTVTEVGIAPAYTVVRYRVTSAKQEAVRAVLVGRVTAEAGGRPLAVAWASPYGDNSRLLVLEPLPEGATSLSLRFAPLEWERVLVDAPWPGPPDTNPEWTNFAGEWRTSLRVGGFLDGNVSVKDGAGQTYTSNLYRPPATGPWMGLRQLHYAVAILIPEGIRPVRVRYAFLRPAQAPALTVELPKR